MTELAEVTRNPRVAGSFRDPSGFLFQRDAILYRQINKRYAQDYDLLMSSGLYANLTDKGWLVAHEEVDVEAEVAEDAYKIIQPKRIGFISYPYEWSFSQYRDAALLTLFIQARAIEHGLILKDASAYNIQFDQGKPVFIDTLSFETYTEGEPWIAYGQFVQHFLAPLALMCKSDVRLSALMRTNIGGVPVDVASKILPWRTRLNFGLLTHIHMLARSQRKHADDAGAEAKEVSRGKVSKRALLAINDSLKNTVRKLKWTPDGTEWGDYYEATNYTDVAMTHKQKLVAAFLDKLDQTPKQVWDLGANTGEFSRIAAQRGIDTVAFDIDPAAVEKNYRQIKQGKEQNMLPLVMDLTNPSPDIGWHGREREGLLTRGPADMVFALALIHHLAISNNVPLDDLADFFADVCKHLIIEFVPKEDSQVRRLLATREDIFPDYSREGFEAAFSHRFEIQASEPVAESARVLYLMNKKS